MTNNKKQISNPFSTGGGGIIFETHVQASFVTLMLSGGFSPCLPPWPIKKIKLQGKYAGYDTDDAIIFVEKPNDKEERKLLCQIKHSVSITNNKKFAEVIQSAWNDFNNLKIFTKGKDLIALIAGPLSDTDITDVRFFILDQARHSESSEDFLTRVNLTKFSSKQKIKKLEVFRKLLKSANNGDDVPDEKFWEFMKSFHLLGYDLDHSTARPGDIIHLTLYWQALAEMETSYTVFVHLLDAQSRTWGQKDNAPVKGTHPTTSWLPGEVVIDEYEIVVDAVAPAGKYQIEVGMYDLATMLRLPANDEQGNPLPDDRILLGKVRVE